MTTATTEAARAFKGTDTEGRSEAELQQLVRHAGAELELAPAEVIIEWAVATFGDALLRSPPRWATPCSRTSPPRSRPGIDVVFLDTGYHFAETIGTRDAVEATLPVNLINVTPDADGRRAGRDVRQGPVRPRPRPVLRAAQGQAARGGAGRVRRLGHRPAPRRDPQPGDRAGHRLGRQEAQGQGLPARPLDRRGRRAATSPRTACWSTRCSTTATRRSAAGRAPAGSRRARTRAAAAGPAPARPSAASTNDATPPPPSPPTTPSGSVSTTEGRPPA